MNFYKTLGLKNSRIDVADALRGLAVAGIILYHSVEHFNMYDGSIAHAYTLGCDDWLADVLELLAGEEGEFKSITPKDWIVLRDFAGFEAEELPMDVLSSLMGVLLEKGVL